jgi:hypothetical protein
MTPELVERARVYLGPYLAAEGLAGQMLSKQAAAVYAAAIKAIAALTQSEGA